MRAGGASIRRTVTFVGGITADNLLYQLRLMCVSALKLLGEELGMKSKIRYVLSGFVVICAFAGVYKI